MTFYFSGINGRLERLSLPDNNSSKTFYLGENSNGQAQSFVISVRNVLSLFLKGYQSNGQKPGLIC